MRDPQQRPVKEQLRQQPQGPSCRRRIRHALAVAATLMLVSFHQKGDNVNNNGQSGVVGVSAFTNARTRTTWPMTMKLSGVSPRQASTSSPSRDLSSRSSQRGVGPPAGSPLAMICKDQEEFELHVGHAMDTLRSDYPDILTAKPDFTIYDKNLEVIDPSGVRLYGLENYRGAFSLLHAIVNIFYCPEQSILTFRMCYDKARQNIRIHWNAQVIPKAIFGGVKKPLHVDGISVYEISRLSGNVTQHRVERLIINDAMVMPEQGIFSALRVHAKGAGQIPVYFSPVEMPGAADASGADSSSSCGERNSNNHVLNFQSFSPLARQTSMLFFERRSDGSRDESDMPPTPTSTRTQLESMSSSTDGAAMSDGFAADMDWEAFERKNAYRNKFGLKPLSPEEFVDLEKQVAELSLEQTQKAAAAMAAADLAKQEKQQDKAGGFFKKLFGDALQDTCESNYDCQRPEVCCDFGFTKKCCSSGMRIIDGPVSRQGQLAVIPVTANPNHYPPVNGPRGGNYNGY